MVKFNLQNKAKLHITLKEKIRKRQISELIKNVSQKNKKETKSNKMVVDNENDSETVNSMLSEENDYQEIKNSNTKKLIHDIQKTDSLMPKNLKEKLNIEKEEIEDEIAQLENKIYSNTKKPQKEELMSLVLDSHFLTFQNEKDIYTLLYTSIIFKWIKSEKVSKSEH